MPPQPIKRPKETWTSNLVITIKYGGLKATQYFSKYTNESYLQLLSDLTTLGMPHPKRGNIIFKSHGSLDFFWPVEPRDQSPFARNLTRRVTLPDEGDFKSEQLAQRKELSIVSLTIKEDQSCNPYYDDQPSLSPMFQTPTYGPPQYQQSKPFVHPPAERFHPYSRPVKFTTSNQNPSNGVHQGHQLSKSKQTASSNSTQRAAEMFLDEMKTSLGQPTKFKTEPVEPTIPKFPAKMVAQRRPPLSQKPSLQTQPKRGTPSTSAPSLPSAFPTQLISGNSVQAGSAGTTSQGIPLATPGNPLGNPPRPQVSEVPNPALQIAPPAPPPSPAQVAGGARPLINTPQLNSIRLLQKELMHVRSTIKSAIDRQSDIIDQLNLFNVPHLPSKLSISPIDAAMKQRLAELESQLKVQNEKNSELNKQLEAERAKRLEMEGLVQDVERECKTPFIVPALLEAFVKISHATTAAIRHEEISSLNTNAS